MLASFRSSISLYRLEISWTPIGRPSDVVPQGIVTAGNPIKFAKIQLDGHSSIPSASVPGGRVLDLRNGYVKPLGTLSNLHFVMHDIKIFEFFEF